jgi:cell division protease FtsH
MPDSDKNRFRDLPSPDPAEKSPRLKRQFLFLLLGLIGFVAIMSMVKDDKKPLAKKVIYSEFVARINAEPKDRMLKLVVKGDGITLRGMWKPRRKGEEVWLETSVAVEGLVRDKLPAWTEKIDENPEGEVVVEKPTGRIWIYIMQFLPFVLLLLVMFWYLNRQARAMGGGGGGGWGSFVNKSTIQARKERPNVTFDDVAGIHEAKEEVQELVEFLRNPDKFLSIGGRIPRGVLLVGAPGTGKTLLAKAIAGEADVPFFSLCGSDFVELFVGVGASRVRDLFAKARTERPAIIFLDEIDAVGRKRGTGLGGGHDEREQTLNAILSEMDGFDRDEGVIVMAATNRPDVLDPALLRPGRFDRQVEVDMPDLRGRVGILKVHSRDVTMADGVDLEVIGRGTPGFTGADLETLVNEAAIRTAMKGMKEVTLVELEEARDKVRFGGQRKRSRVMSEADRRMTAFHEAGHAVMALLEPDVEPLHKVTIIPRGYALGMTMVLPEEDRYGMRMRECLGTIRMSLAGRIAEEMFCGDISSGAEGDIRTATDLVRRMVTEWGMSEELGPIRYSDRTEHVFLGNEITQAKQHSDHMAHRIDEEIQRVITESHDVTAKALEAHRAELERVAEALLLVETLSGADVREILDGGTPDVLANHNADEPQESAATATETAGPADSGSDGQIPLPDGSPA